MYRNLTDALVGGLRLLFSEGKIVPSRNGETRELYSHQIRIESPTERVLITPGRANNPFAMVAETIWALGGRNDLEYLSRYLPRAQDFSDDGKTWRGGYGPRLRNWGDRVDQIEECVKILCADPNSRRAVMIIFDPGQDFTESKDVPCNNWLHFLIRDNKLNMTVGVRSNDIIWGFSGINVFLWSALMQMMAHWLDVEVGTMAYTASSFHLYDYHYEMGEKVLADAKGKTLYDFGFKAPAFDTDFESWKWEYIPRFFDIETRLASGVDEKELVEGMQDEFLRTCLQMLAVYHAFKSDASCERLNELLERMPTCDLRVAAIEYLSRQKRTRGLDWVSLRPEEASFFAFYTAPRKDLSVAEIFSVLKVLHEKKSRVYGDSWKKHGEVLGVFSNITRKWDRISAMWGGQAGLRDEGLFDTIADLCVYGGKYLTFRADESPGSFLDFLSKDIDGQVFPIDVDPYKGNDGFNRVVEDFLTDFPLCEDKQELFERLRTSYSDLEEALLPERRREQNPHGSYTSGLAICESATSLSQSCANLLLILARENPLVWTQFSNSVESL